MRSAKRRDKGSWLDKVIRKKHNERSDQLFLEKMVRGRMKGREVVITFNTEVVRWSVRRKPCVLRSYIYCAGYTVLSVWSWCHACSPDSLSWNVSFVVINLVQVLVIASRLRPICLSPQLQQLYVDVFRPLNVSRFHWSFFSDWLARFPVSSPCRQYPDIRFIIEGVMAKFVCWSNRKMQFFQRNKPNMQKLESITIKILNFE